MGAQRRQSYRITLDRQNGFAPATVTIRNVRSQDEAMERASQHLLGRVYPSAFAFMEVTRIDQ
jgi:hypothetical protein